MSDSYAVLPSAMGDKEKPKDPRLDPHKFIPDKRGGLLLKDPNEEKCPYTFKDSPMYVAQKKQADAEKRGAELETKDETRGFLRSVEELGKKHKWEEAFQILERRTAIPSGLFLVTRAVLRWKFAKYAGALVDAEEALKNYGSSAKAGPLAAAFASFLRICMGSQVRDKFSCTKEMNPLVGEWEDAEHGHLRRSGIGENLFQPRAMERLTEPTQVCEGYEAHDGLYVAAPGVRIGYTLLKNTRDLVSAPVVIHFHGSNETCADYRSTALAEKYFSLGVHMLVVDYRGYGWSTGDEAPSLATFLRDAEPLAEGLGELFVQFGFSWPYSGGLIMSGRSLGAQVAVHLATMFPTLFRYLMLDSAMATSATGDRLGRAPERNAALECWRSELEKASLEVLAPLSAELWVISAQEKIRAFDGELLVLHGLADETVPYEGSEGLHAAAGCLQAKKQLVLVEEAGHNNIGHYDAYWSAQKSFFLKVQLNDNVADSGTVQHLCAVCAEKAVSKCGRCQKVWYCGRKHQAEHWKGHKETCAGGPPEKTTKVEAEAEACLVTVVTANVTCEADATALCSCLRSLDAQEAESLQAIYLSWHAATPELAAQVTSELEKLPKVVASRAPKLSEQFEHISLLAGPLADAPAHSWVAFVDACELWNTRSATLLVPALRKAAADQRIIAACCRSHATSVVGKETARQGSAAEVDLALEAGSAELLAADANAAPNIVDHMVKVKTLLAFLEATPAGMISHNLCTHYFLNKISHTFGKKVHTITLPETDARWVRWVARREEEEVRPNEEDRRRGQEFFDSLKKTERYTDAEVPSQLCANFRQSVLLRMAKRTGETLTNKEFKAITLEPVTDFLEKNELSDIFGLNRWLRDTASEIAEAAAELFSITVSSE